MNNIFIYLYIYNNFKKISSIKVKYYYFKVITTVNPMLSWVKFCKKNGRNLSIVLRENLVIKSFINKKECLEYYKKMNECDNGFRWSLFILKEDNDQFDFNFVYSVIDKIKEIYISHAGGLLIMTEKIF